MHPYATPQRGTPAHHNPPVARPMQPPPPPPGPPYLPPYGPYNPGPIGNGEYHVPGAPMYAPWMHAQPYNVPPYPPMHQPFPHLQRVPGAVTGAPQFQPWDYIHRPLPAPITLAEPTAMQAGNGQAPYMNDGRMGNIERAGNVERMGNIEGTGLGLVGATAASTGGTQTQKNYPNKQICNGVWRFAVQVVRMWGSHPNWTCIAFDLDRMGVKPYPYVISHGAWFLYNLSATRTSDAAGKATGPQSPDAIGGSPQMQIHAEDVSSPQYSQTRGGDVSNPQVAQMREGDVPDPRITQMREGEPPSMPERQEEAMSARPMRVGIHIGRTPPTDTGEGPSSLRRREFHLQNILLMPEIVWVDIPTKDTITFLYPRHQDDLPPHIKGRAQWGKPQLLPADASEPTPPRQKVARLLEGEETRHDQDVRPDSYYIQMGSLELPIEFINAEEWHRLHWQVDQGKYTIDGNGQLAAYRCGLGTPGQPAVLGQRTRQRSKRTPPHVITDNQEPTSWIPASKVTVFSP
ncbi:hypothetical protein BC826DRAFT_976657 [Russula brevipes]|nr:hypothetical protein BC826DRAFT_976657 [Russula brevipes]